MEKGQTYFRVTTRKSPGMLSEKYPAHSTKIHFTWQSPKGFAHPDKIQRGVLCSHRAVPDLLLNVSAREREALFGDYSYARSGVRPRLSIVSAISPEHTPLRKAHPPGPIRSQSTAWWKRLPQHINLGLLLIYKKKRGKTWQWSLLTKH